ncbi:unnamed protein product [Alopecurus aequalis]
MKLGDQGTKDEDGRRTWSGGDGYEKDLHKRPHADSSDDDEGTRQPYNCTFCRRGFPTAQALGGHMNVHRKNRTGVIRASTAPAARTPAVLDALMGYGLVADPAASGSLLHAERAPQELRLFGRVMDGGAGAGRRNEHGGAYGDRRDGYHGEQEEEEELDLELRLGAAGQ